MSGSLYLVALPIGNQGDITLRALDTLRTVDAIVAEDTRNTQRLLTLHEIQTPFFTSLYQGAEERRVDRILHALGEGKNLALVSDAGTPLISDPGYRLVRAATDADIPVIPIPGPTAAIAALTASGLPTDRFVFEGSMPRKRQGRAALLDRLEREPRTAVLYESPHRVEQTLEEIAKRFPDRPMAVGRELTKIHEEVIRGTASEILESLQVRGAVRGEFVLMIAGSEDTGEERDTERIEAVISHQLGLGVPGKAIANLLCLTFGLRRNEAYRMVQEAKRGNPEP